MDQTMLFSNYSVFAAESVLITVSNFRGDPIYIVPPQKTTCRITSLFQHRLRTLTTATSFLYLWTLTTTAGCCSFCLHSSILLEICILSAVDFASVRAFCKC